jgi:hypothetical protein
MRERKIENFKLKVRKEKFERNREGKERKRTKERKEALYQD